MVEYSVVIQAGGASKRMGYDKALAPFINGTMLEYLIDQVKGLGREMFIISNNPVDYQRFNLPVFSDVIKGIGALGGIYTALYHTNTDYCLLLACDMPYVNLDVIKLLLGAAEGHDVVVPRIGDGLFEPFRAVYGKACLPQILKAIENGERKAISFFENVNVHYIEEAEITKYDPNLDSFFNVNTPEDLEKARELALRDWNQAKE